MIRGEEYTVYRRPAGRKFIVVIMAVFLLALGMSAGVLAAYSGVDLSWLGLVLPILASVLPAYLGANAYQKSKSGDKNKDVGA